MSLIVEDGSGLSDAESLCSVAYATTYHADRGNTTWAALTTAEQEQALRKATEYMQEIYGERWKGVRAYPIRQRLDWPRAWADVDLVPVGYNSVPDDVARACASLALRASTAALAPDISRQLDSLDVGGRVGGVKLAYNKGAPPYTRYREIDTLLAKYLDRPAGSLVVLRA